MSEVSAQFRLILYKFVLKSFSGLHTSASFISLRSVNMQISFASPYRLPSEVVFKKGPNTSQHLIHDEFFCCRIAQTCCPCQLPVALITKVKVPLIPSTGHKTAEHIKVMCISGRLLYTCTTFLCCLVMGNKKLGFLHAVGPIQVFLYA